MKKRHIVIAMVALCGAAFGQLINDAQFIDNDWSVSRNNTMDLIAGGTGPANFGVPDPITQGPAPVLDAGAGTVTFSMTGATSGFTRYSTGNLNAYTFAAADNYIITTRVRVDTFADTSSTPASFGTSLFDIRDGVNRTYINVEADKLWISGDGNTWSEIGTSVATAASQYYTWQFEVDKVNNTVDIYRRDLDADAFTAIATGVGTRVQTTPTQILLNPIYYNGEGSEIQGVMTSDYFQLGVAIPEPATLGLVAGAGLLLLAVRRFRI